MIEMGFITEWRLQEELNIKFEKGEDKDYNRRDMVSRAKSENHT